MAGSPQYGVSPPLSVAGPAESDVQRTRRLQEFLKVSGLYESPEEETLRKEVLAEIDQIAKAWVKAVTIAKGLEEEIVSGANAKIFTFGSYRLSVHGPGADLDTLCVGPCYVNREEDFFLVLHEILAETPEVTELQPIPDAHVPIMKFKVRGISVDLIYACVDLPTISEVLPTLREIHDEFRLRELLKRWENHKVMVQWLSKFFTYLDRTFVLRGSLPTLKDAALICFRDSAYEEVKDNVKDVVIAQIDLEHEGEKIDRALLKNIISIFVEIGMGQMDFYENTFVSPILGDTTAFYSRKAALWILEDMSTLYAQG